LLICPPLFLTGLSLINSGHYYLGLTKNINILSYALEIWNNPAIDKQFSGANYD